VEGYAVQCEFSLDGTILASGSDTGSAHFYDYHNARMLHTLHAHSQPCLCLSIPSCLQPRPPVTGLARSRSGIEDCERASKYGVKKVAR
ncbi:WD repeat-containing protein 25, partial [Lates japonicus]